MFSYANYKTLHDFNEPSVYRCLYLQILAANDQSTVTIEFFKHRHVEKYKSKQTFQVSKTFN